MKENVDSATLTRFRASSHACFISVTLALLTLTSSLSDDAVAVASSPDIELVLLVLGFESPSPLSTCGPAPLLPRAGMDN